MTVTCERCGLVFEPGQTDADAAIEMQENFSERERAQPEGHAVLCDECYRALMAWLKAHPEMRF